MKDKRILLIGGAGFIGHHLSLQLKSMGADVHIMDSLGVNNIAHHAADSAEYTSDPTLLPFLFQRLKMLRDKHIPIHVGDAGNIHSAERIFDIVKPDVVVFLAAISHASYSNERPLFAFENNLRSFHNVLYLCRDQAEQIVYFSSSMVYGDFLTPTVNETSPTSPKGVYGHFKLMGEQMCHLYNTQFGVNYTTIRPSALYGRRCVSRRVSQIFIEKAILGEPLAIEGDGESRLDFTHIDDLVSGVISTIGNPKAYNETFNLTYGSSRSLADLIEVLKEYFPDLQVEHKPVPKSYVKRGTLSIDKARAVLGYEPANDISVGYRKYIEWSIEHAELIKANAKQES